MWVWRIEPESSGGVASAIPSLQPHECVSLHVWQLGDNPKDVALSSAMWVLEIKLQESGFVAVAISLTLCCLLIAFVVSFPCLEELNTLIVL